MNCIDKQGLSTLCGLINKSLQNGMDEAVADIDETASQALNTLNASCGFDSNGVYTPSHELLEGATNLRFALDILAAYVEKLEERITTLEESA